MKRPQIVLYEQAGDNGKERENLLFGRSHREMLHESLELYLGPPRMKWGGKDQQEQQIEAIIGSAQSSYQFVLNGRL